MINGKICFAQVGVGYWGPNLLRNATSIPDATLKYACDLSAARRSYVASKYPQLQCTDSFQKCLDDPEVDALIIATPVRTHFDLALQALKAGKHILVEKPLTTSSAEAEELTMVARQQGKVLMTGHTFVYHSAVHYLKQLIESGELGQVRYIYSQRLNLGRIRSDVDALWNLAPHDISIIQFLLGDPTPLSVSRQGVDYVQHGIDDVVFVNIRYPNRIMANIHVSWLDPNRTRRMTIVGSDRMAVYDDDLPNKIAIYDKGIERFAVLGENMDYDNPNGFEFSYRSGDKTEPKIDYVEPLRAELLHFIDCIVHGTECLTGPHHATRVIKILEACNKPKPLAVETSSSDTSAENGQKSQDAQTAKLLVSDKKLTGRLSHGHRA